MKKALFALLWMASSAFALAAPSADDMVMAAKKDDAATIQEGLKAGFDPNYKDRQGNSLLIHAAANTSESAVDALLKGGADPKMKKAGIYPACDHWKSIQRPETQSEWPTLDSSCLFDLPTGNHQLHQPHPQINQVRGKWLREICVGHVMACAN